MPVPRLDSLPGFRRRFRITPVAGAVSCEVEDDYHCMIVTVHHDSCIATRVEATMRRAPWTTCPGAEAKLRETFTGLPLAAFDSRGDKKTNCTHLYDLAQLAAVHAADETPLIYDILVADPTAGRRRAELRRNGEPLLAWTEANFTLVEPAELVGLALFDMNPWIESLPPSLQEVARLLRWGTILANGRSIPLAQQSDASRMPPNCYTFQPERAAVARRVGEVRDFSATERQPLAAYEVAL